MIEGAYESDALQSATTINHMPAPVTPILATFWQQAGEFGKSPFKGFGQGINEVARFLNEWTPTTSPEGEKIQQQLKPMLTSGVDYYRPDPLASTAASNVVHGFTQFATKAIGYSAVTGSPITGAALTGADTGTNTSLDLQAQGIDKATADKVGVVTGIGAGASTLIPVVGSTVGRTVGLALAGGPATYIAENLAAQQILKHAHYDTQAQQFQPFDPVGLLVATAFPMFFGLGVHSMESRAGKPGVKPTDDQVAAAHTVLFDNAKAESALVSPENVAGMAQHDRALVVAAEQMQRGEQVDVGDIAPVDAAGAAKIGEFARRLGEEPEHVASDIHDTDPVEPLPAASPPTDRARPEPAEPNVIDGLGKSATETIRGTRVAGEEVSPALQNTLIGSSESSGESSVKSAQSPFAERLKQLEQSNPNALDEMHISSGDESSTESMSAREFLAHAQLDAEKDKSDASLLMAAAECFIST